MSNLFLNSNLKNGCNIPKFDENMIKNLFLAKNEFRPIGHVQNGMSEKYVLILRIHEFQWCAKSQPVPVH